LPVGGLDLASAELLVGKKLASTSLVVIHAMGLKLSVIAFLSASAQSVTQKRWLPAM
jgi:hypothetical protein